jgi:hypothetical protein
MTDEEFEALGSIEEKIDSLTDDLTFAMLANNLFAHLISRAVLNRIDVVFWPAPNPTNPEEINIRLSVRHRYQTGRLQNRNTFIRIEAVGMVAI